LALQNIQCAAAERDLAIHSGLGAVLVYAIYDRLVDTDFACDEVAIMDGQGNLLGLPQPSEESKLLVVAMGQPEFLMRGGDDQFPFLNRKRIDGRPIFFLNAERRKTRCRIVLLGVILVPEVEGAS